MVLNHTTFFAQNDTLSFKSSEYKNSFHLGAGYGIQGAGDQVSILYQGGYQRKLNKYFEMDFGLSYFQYKGFTNINVYEPSVVKEEKTSIVTIDLLLNFLIIDFNRHILKLGTGYSLQKIELTAWAWTQYYYDDNYNYLYATYGTKNVDNFIGSLIINIEYGYRFLPHWAVSINGRYYSENKYISLASLGLNFYYTF